MKRHARMAYLVAAAGLAVSALATGCQRGPAASTGHTTITLHATSTTPAGALDRAKDLLTHRFTDAGLTGVQVASDGPAGLRVQVDGKPSRDRLATLIRPGQLGFRRVLASRPEPTASGTSTTGSPSWSPSTGSGGVAGQLPTLDEVKGLLGPAYQLALGLTGDGPVDPQTVTALSPFATLSPDQVAVLPADLRYRVPTIDCRQLSGRTAPFDPATGEVLCDEQARYLLDAAAVVGTDVASAKATHDDMGGWLVDVAFTSAGQARWTELTRQLVRGGAEPGQVAIVLDGRVVSAPVVRGVITGAVQIAGGFDKSAATDLAAKLNAGMLPVTFTIKQIDTA